MEEILADVIQTMSEHLDSEQLNRLKNVLYIKFRGKEIKEEKYELQDTGVDGDDKKIQLFCACKQICGLQKSTLKQYVREITNCRMAINKSFADITAMDIRWYLGMLQEQRKVKMSTLQNCKQYLSTFWTFLTTEGLVKTNPIKKIGNFRVPQELKKAYTAGDLEPLRLACTQTRDRAIIEFLLCTGLRVSELCSLNVGDLDMSRQEFRVTGKGAKERIAYFSDASSFHLFRYFRERLEKEKISLEELKTRPLFVSLKKPHSRLTRDGVRTLLKRIAQKAEVDCVHPHRFRRTFATWALSVMKLEEVKTLMGHEKMDTTLIYCDIKQDNIREAYRRSMAA